MQRKAAGPARHAGACRCGGVGVPTWGGNG